MLRSHQDPATMASENLKTPFVSSMSHSVLRGSLLDSAPPYLKWLPLKMSPLLLTPPHTQTQPVL